MLKDKNKIATFLYGSFVTKDQWKNRNDLFNYASFILSNEEFLPEDIDTKQTLKQKATFYKGAYEALDIIVKAAKISGDKVVCAGAFFDGTNYYNWKDRRKFAVYARLKKTIGIKQSALLNIEDDIVLLGDIVLGGFKYLSKIGLFLKTANALIIPTHNMELIVFSDTLENVKKLFCEAIAETNWKIVESKS